MSEKIDRIAELVIDIEGMDEELFDEFGVEVVSIVDEPAIGVDFLSFAQEFIYPKASEDRDTFLDRCMGDTQMISEFPDNDQRYAVCNAYFEGEEQTFSKESEEAIIEFCTNNGEELTSEDIIIDLTQKEFAGVKDVIEAIQSLDILKRLSIKREEPAEEYWRYQGPPAERRFCKAMVNLSKAGKIFSKADIKKMDGINKQFARKGQSSYSVLKFKGGKNCKHYWQKLKVFKNGLGQKVVIVAQPEGKTEITASETWANMNFSLDDEKRIVTGPLMIPNKMMVRRDKQTNEPYYVYFSRNTIRKMAEKFLALNKHNNTDTMHDYNITTSNTLLESWISESVQHDKSFKYGFALPVGTWYVSYKINDEATWSRIKEGELKGFSLAGPFVEKLTNEQRDNYTLNKIKEILKDVT